MKSNSSTSDVKRTTGGVGTKASRRENLNEAGTGGLMLMLRHRWEVTLGIRNNTGDQDLLHKTQQLVHLRTQVQRWRDRKPAKQASIATKIASLTHNAWLTIWIAVMYVQTSDFTHLAGQLNVPPVALMALLGLIGVLLSLMTFHAVLLAMGGMKSHVQNIDWLLAHYKPVDEHAYTLLKQEVRAEGFMPHLILQWLEHEMSEIEKADIKHMPPVSRFVHTRA